MLYASKIGNSKIHLCSNKGWHAFQNLMSVTVIYRRWRIPQEGGACASITKLCPAENSTASIQTQPQPLQASRCLHTILRIMHDHVQGRTYTPRKASSNRGAAENNLLNNSGARISKWTQASKSHCNYGTWTFQLQYLQCFTVEDFNRQDCSMLRKLTHIVFNLFNLLFSNCMIDLWSMKVFMIIGVFAIASESKFLKHWHIV